MELRSKKEKDSVVEENHQMRAIENSKETVMNELTMENRAKNQGIEEDELIQYFSTEEHDEIVEYPLLDDVVEYHVGAIIFIFQEQYE